MGKVFDRFGLGAAIVAARGPRTQKDVALDAGISDSTLSRYEQGDRPEGLDILFRILKSVGLEMALVARNEPAPGNEHRTEVLVYEDGELTQEQMKAVDSVVQSFKRRVER